MANVTVSRDKRMQWRIHYNPGNGHLLHIRRSYVRPWNAKRAARKLFGADIDIEVIR